MMMVRAVLCLLMATILPSQGVKLWRKDTDYMDFAIMKSCFGEEVAVPLERFAYSVGQFCEGLKETSGNSIPVEFTSDRKKRALVKLPQDPPPNLVVCNLRKLGLLKDNDKVDFAMVEDLLRGARIEAGLKKAMTEVLTTCRSERVELPELLPGSPDNDLVKALVAIGNYFTCVISGGMRTCREFEMRRHFPDLQ
ncbi:uncharacterized protein [Panulirus ornatus]|uniref:uncharacterized protein n=1 Tax=Panulirus ornatus TaxID=150431 RepID=UPI003A877E36